jgi:hypothetical protein
LSFLKSDVFILVILSSIDESYLQSGDGSSQISATINAPDKSYAESAAHAFVNGKLHIFGGYYDGYKVLFCLANQIYEFGKISIIEFENNSQDCAIGRLLFERNSGATQQRTKSWSRGSFGRKWTKR